MDPLVWLYFANAVLLINHEIDSAYWKEWKQFKATFGWFRNDDDTNNMKWFLIIHFFMIFVILFGLIEVYKASMIGYVCSIILSAGGMLAFFFHTYYIKNGRREFKVPISKFILSAMPIVSIA